MTQPDWAARSVRVVAEEIRRYRQARSWSAQQLADATEAAGHAIPRSVLANLESGRRETVTVPELAVLASVLGVSPIELVFPLGHAETVEILPGQQVPTWSAVKWWTGEAHLPGTDLGALGSADRARPPSSLDLHREHERHLAEWSRRRQQALVAAIAPQGRETPAQEQDRKQAVADAERAARLEEEALGEIRQRMRRYGFTPPPLYDPRLRYLDGGEE